MREFRLQPASVDDFRRIYTTSLNYPVMAGLTTLGADSTVFFPGLEVLADGRSDSGSVEIDRLIIVSESTIPFRIDGSFGIIARAPISAETLRAWRQMGSRAALISGDLEPLFAGRPIFNLVILRLTRRTAAELLGIAADQLDDFITVNDGRVISLDSRVHARAATRYEPQIGAINIMGYFAGKHPTRARELVLVCADMDARGQMAGIPTLDFQNFGHGPAALLEVARNMGRVTSRWHLPERTVMFAIWSGSILGHQGLRHFLDNPTWPLDRITSVIYVGLPADQEDDVRSLFSRYELPLRVIPMHDEFLPGRSISAFPGSAVRRLLRGAGRELAEPDLPRMSDVLRLAVEQAGELAAGAFDLTVLESTSAEPFIPVREDSLLRPREGGSH